MIPILNAEECRIADAYTIKSLNIDSLQLMERAAGACVDRFIAHYPVPARVVILAGRGNNGGDGICVARLLAEKGWQTELFMTSDPEYCASDARIQFEKTMAQGKVNVSYASRGHRLELRKGVVVIDALFGTGVTRPLEAESLQWIHALNSSEAEVVSLDLPSGMPCEPLEWFNGNQVVKARRTYMLQTPKLSAFLPETASCFGNWELVDFGLLTQGVDCRKFMIQPESVAKMVAPREPFAHKGTFGHALLVAGSHGMMGAAILAAHACLRGGAGMVTARIPDRENCIMQIAVPEAMTDTSPIEEAIGNLSKFSAIGMGPGLGRSEEAQKATQQIITHWKGALVVDADALNHLAAQPLLLEQLPPGSVLTPHPGEFSRLLASIGREAIGSMAQIKEQLRFSSHYEVVVILKGRYSSISLPDGTLWLNTTGNPGMATAGSGDVLTGIVLSLLAQRLSSAEAAITAACLHGLAGDILAGENGEASLIAGDLSNALGKAYKKLLA